MQRITRRAAIGWSAALAVSAPASGAVASAARRPPGRRRRKRQPPLGAGGEPMSLPELAALAKEVGHGEPLMLVDLAALDQNLDVLRRFAAESGMAFRPALKTLEAPALCAYVLQRLSEPRGLIHHIRHVDQVMARAPAGTDLLTGYPPTLGELAAYLRSAPPARQRPHRLRILVDSVPLLGELARLARAGSRPLPLDVALEIDSGAGRGGMNDRAEVAAAIEILRAERDRLRLGALLCYDAGATVSGNPAFLRVVAEYAQGRVREVLDQLREQAADVVDVDALLVNGPGSTNYRNWTPPREGGVANEFSAGSAILYPEYLDGGWDVRGLAKATVLCSPVLRITSGHPTVPVLQSEPPSADREEILIKAGGWPTGNNPELSKLVWPEGMEEDPASGGRGANSSGAVTAPKGALALGDYVLLRAEQITEALDYFGALHAVREGSVRRVWRNASRWSGTPD